MPPTEELVETEETEGSPVPPSQLVNTMAAKLTELMAPFQKTQSESVADPVQPPKPQTQAPPPKTPADKPVIAPPQEKKDEEPLPESIRHSPKASEEFKKIRNSERQFKAEAEKHAAALKTLQEELAKVKSAPPAPSVKPEEFESIKKFNEQLKKDYDAMSDQIKLVNIERHPQFRSHFEGRTTAAIEKAKATLGDDVTTKAVRLAQTPPSDFRTEQLDKMITEMQETSPSKAMFLSALVQDINAIVYDRDAALKKARDDYDAVQRHDLELGEQAKAQKISKRNAMISRALDAARDMESFKRGDDVSKNEAVLSREAFVKAFLNDQVDEDHLPLIPVLAQEAAYLKETLIPSLREENAKLLQQIKEMTQSTPRPHEGSGSQSRIDNEDPVSKAQRILRENLPRR